MPGEALGSFGWVQCRLFTEISVKALQRALE
jgi:hypothetical protein